ncbi:hypothetical protein ACEPPN_003157 [Leptodophora sp. 'Broadleaf-Isolate-01']
MSFGFSVGDFIAGAKLIKDIITALNGAPELEHRGLELELYGLERALDELGHLEPGFGQEADVDSVKEAALLCRYPLEEFREKLNRYRVWSQGGERNRMQVLQGLGRKVQWTLSMPDEIQRLRAYIAAHVGSLNMRLLTLGLTSMAISERESRMREIELFNMLERQALSTSQNSTQSGLIYKLIVQTVIPQLQNIAGIARKVLLSNLQILAYVTDRKSPRVDSKYTWFQQPLRFEDAVGRVVPIPVEYGWSTAEAVVRGQFSSGPGHDKVFAGEYEIFYTEDSSKLVTKDTWQLLRPGTYITMAMVIGKYVEIPENLCPKLGCASRDFVKVQAGGSTCSRCHTWFGKAQKSLQRPFRLLQAEALSEYPISKIGDSKEIQNETSGESSCIFKIIREERKWFKNVRVFLTDLSVADRILEHQKIFKVLTGISSVTSTITTLGDQTAHGSLTLATTKWYPQTNTGPSQVVGDEIWSHLMAILLEEMGLQELPEDFGEDERFYEIGMDSLMALFISARFREETDILLSSSVFWEYPTLRELRTFLRAEWNIGGRLVGSS